MGKRQDIVTKLRELHKQATEERSHHYTGKVVLEAIEEIGRLQSALSHTLDSVTDDPSCPECKAARRLIGWPS